MSTGCQKDRKTETEIKTFQHSCQNKSCSECQQDFKKSIRQALYSASGRQTE